MCFGCVLKAHNNNAAVQRSFHFDELARPCVSGSAVGSRFGCRRRKSRRAACLAAISRLLLYSCKPPQKYRGINQMYINHPSVCCGRARGEMYEFTARAATAQIKIEIDSRESAPKNAEATVFALSQGPIS
jgi:hypothetical protein